MKDYTQDYSNRLCLTICLIGSSMVVFKMMTGSNLFLLLFLALVSLGIIIDRIENKIIYILYFVPWAYAIKFSFDQLSLLTVLSALYCMICVLYIFMNRVSVSIYYLVIIFGVFIYGFFSLIVNPDATIIGILSFLLKFVVIYFATLFVQQKEKIPVYILFHALGLTVSGGVSFMGNSLPVIQNYIASYTVLYTVNTTGTLYTRFAGMDMDPNYFSIQALIAIACLGYLLFTNQIAMSVSQKVSAYSFITLLSIMGVLSLSKMFLISFGIFLIVIISITLQNNLKKGLYYLLIVSSVIGGAIYLFYDYLYEAFFFRFFSEGTGAGSITTGRSEIWAEYYFEITGNARVLFLGNGISDQFLNDHISHNMYLIAWYYLGLIGIILFLFLFSSMYFQLKTNLQIKSSFSLLSISIIPLLIVLLANFSLDSFVMDYFGIHVFLTLLILSLDDNKGLKSLSLVNLVVDPISS